MAIREASPLGHHSTLPAGGRVPWVCQEGGPPEPPKPRFLDRVRHAIETRHYSRRTEKAYVHWIKRFIFFHGKRHPAEMGAAEVTAFLTSLAVDHKVSASCKAAKRRSCRTSTTTPTTSRVQSSATACRTRR
jgi:hypothetical protein